MYNLHSHSLLSDGVLLPSEIAARYLFAGYKAIAITDHVDYSNIRPVATQTVEFCRQWPAKSGIIVLPGVELTHIPPEQFKPLARIARGLGVKVIIGHGATPIEPVAPGTNRAALLAGIDILAHPGKISVEDARLAAKKGIFLEVTTRKGHNLANRRVVRTALAAGAKLIIDLGAERRVLVLPRAVLQSDQQGEFVYVAGSDNIARRRKVTTAPLPGEDKEITSGLSAGEQVVVSGYAKLTDGQTVQISAPGKSGAAP